MRALSRPHALPLALPHLSPAVTLQVAFADRILLNKLDLVTAEEVVEVEVLVVVVFQVDLIYQFVVVKLLLVKKSLLLIMMK